AVYDPAGNRLILFGGDGDTDSFNDAWQLSLAATPTWSKLSPTGTPPTARANSTCILDAPRNRVVIFGGCGHNGVALSETWALPLAGGTSCTQILPTGGPPPARGEGAAVFDPLRNRMLVFGGESPCCGPDSTVWALALTGTPAWSALTVTG